MSNGFVSSCFWSRIWQARRLFSARSVLGTEPYAEGPYCAGFHVGEQEIGLDPSVSSSGLNAVVSYRRVDDIKASWMRYARRARKSSRT